MKTYKKNKTKQTKEIKKTKEIGEKENFFSKIIKKLKHWFNKKFKKEEKATYSLEEVIIIMLFSLGLGFFACISFVKIFSGGKDYLKVSKDLEKVIDTYYAIVDNYYGDLDKSKLIDGAVDGMISSVGDNYTTYTNTEDTDSFLETVTGKYEGIGCYVTTDKDGNVIVYNIFENSPAAKAGLKDYDVIKKLDDIDYSGKTYTDVSDYIKNKDSSKIKITILRDNEEKDIIVERSEVEIPTISTNIVESGNKTIGYINISLFTSVTDKQFEKALAKLENQNIEGLVIDVRNNNGGYLSVVTNIINMFLEKGKPIYQLEDGKGTTITKDTTKTKRSYPVAIVTNGASASASEILASAIKESYSKGFVVGTHSYGKGTVQQTMALPDGSMIKYTVQKWLTPKGNWINGVGVEPTNTIELSAEYFNTYSTEDDNQLQEAIRLVSE